MIMYATLSWSFHDNFRQPSYCKVLKLKSCVINRAPVMMAWSMLVAEKMQFSRAEALSIGAPTFHGCLHLLKRVQPLFIQN